MKNKVVNLNNGIISVKILEVKNNYYIYRACKMKKRLNFIISFTFVFFFAIQTVSYTQEEHIWIYEFLMSIDPFGSALVSDNSIC